jgi:hypothetical protein
VPDACRSFIRNSSAARALGDKIQHPSFSTRNAYYQPSVFVAVLATEGDSAFAIDQTGDIRGITYGETEYGA